MLLTLWLMSILVFVVTSVLPGSVAQTILGKSATPSQVAALQRQLDLDHPPHVLYLRWITGFVTGDWGNSHSLQVP
ncbi:MAG: transporter permease, partial [Thermomicrobiales bacterium]|nr:transporter permease [Thermomicrobiales bacterium]